MRSVAQWCAVGALLYSTAYVGIRHEHILIAQDECVGDIRIRAGRFCSGTNAAWLARVAKPAFAWPAALEGLVRSR
ncbi:MAG: hypothetical protein KUG77_06725 [Nannocystaceae bacterium]|nr:hypothetical protein [Nannocystaceae bacterium]